jgi:hypothetical protein
MRSQEGIGRLRCLSGNEFQVFLSVALCANGHRDVPTSLIIGEEEQDIDIDHLKAAIFAEMSRGELRRDSVEKSFDLDFQIALDGIPEGWCVGAGR